MLLLGVFMYFVVFWFMFVAFHLTKFVFNRILPRSAKVHEAQSVPVRCLQVVNVRMRLRETPKNKTRTRNYTTRKRVDERTSLRERKRGTEKTKQKTKRITE